MLILGALITLGAAIAFLVVGALALVGSANATSAQLIPGFRPDRPGPLERALALLGVWVPVALLCLLCLLAGIKMFGVVAAAF